MFSFLFKRGARSAAAAKTEVAQKVIEQAALKASTTQASENARKTILMQAATLSDEAAAIAFIAQADFADARLQAAQLVHSQPGLEQVFQAMRNVDKRVAKLMQTRLNVLRQQQQTVEQVASCVQQAQRLVQAPSLLANQVVELDRAWQLVLSPTDVQTKEFEQLRTSLAQRLSDQATLQRAVLALIAEVQVQTHIQQEQEGDAELQTELQTADSLTLQVTQAEARMQTYLSHEEAISLPKNLPSAFSAAIQTLQLSVQNLQRHQKANAAREAQLQQKMPIMVNAMVNVDETMEFEANKLEMTSSSDKSVGQDVVVSQPSKNIAQKVDTSALQQQFSIALSGLETSLEEGALQMAMDHDKALRLLDFKAFRIAAADQSRLTQARSELGRLQGWARWGGNVSREEL
ncbi:MAG: hypothetical protein NWQ13_07320, partial [Glaciimonas sp.]|nr:hypothetical protein [Glaciimonas sp.]